MALEVEVKYRAPDRARLLERLASIGAAFVGEERHRDCYFAPPHRDFAKTDEALRIRRTEAVGWITYKGPKLDGVTKTRKEIEAALDPKSADYLGEILKELSFKPVREVVKTRQVYTLAYQGFPVSIALDSVEGLEGAFAELEIHAEDEDFDDARSAILSLAGAMELKDSERRS
jgi:adenylate cyclase class 2